MIVESVEWDEHNLEHATRRVSVREIEQAIWNAIGARRHRRHSSRVVISSVTDDGKPVVVIAHVTHRGLRPITAWEGRA